MPLPCLPPPHLRGSRCKDVPSRGPWGQAEGLSEPSLLLERYLGKEGKAIGVAEHCHASPCPLREILTSCRTVWGAQRWLRDRQNGVPCPARSLPTTTTGPLPSSQPWHGARAPISHRDAALGSLLLPPVMARKPRDSLGSTLCPVTGEVQGTLCSHPYPGDTSLGHSFLTSGQAEVPTGVLCPTGQVPGTEIPHIMGGSLPPAVPELPAGTCGPSRYLWLLSRHRRGASARRQRGERGWGGAGPTPGLT